MDMEYRVAFHKPYTKDSCIPYKMSQCKMSHFSGEITDIYSPQHTYEEHILSLTLFPFLF